jgi:hypothetical protein
MRAVSEPLGNKNRGPAVSGGKVIPLKLDTTSNEDMQAALEVGLDLHRVSGSMMMLTKV